MRPMKNGGGLLGAIADYQNGFFKPSQSRRANQYLRKTQDDPHNLRRLRRPTGPRRAALRTLSYKIL